MTNIGLRSLSLRLLDLTSLDMSYCTNLDDVALTVIASGCWQLLNVTLRGMIFAEAALAQKRSAENFLRFPQALSLNVVNISSVLLRL